MAAPQEGSQEERLSTVRPRSFLPEIRALRGTLVEVLRTIHSSGEPPLPDFQILSSNYISSASPNGPKNRHGHKAAKQQEVAPVTQPELKPSFTHLEQATEQELLCIIYEERDKDLEERRHIARDRKARQPNDININFTNLLIEVVKPELLLSRTAKMNPPPETAIPMTLPLSLMWKAHHYPSLLLLAHLSRKLLTMLLFPTSCPITPPPAATHLLQTIPPHTFLPLTIMRPRSPSPAGHCPASTFLNDVSSSGNAEAGQGKCCKNKRDTKGGESRQKPEAHTGSLMKEQLLVLRDKNTEITGWITQKAIEWGVSTNSTMVNLGFDGREHCSLNFWNVFQTVFLHDKLEEMENEGKGDDENNTEVMQDECYEAYQALKLDKEEMTEEQLEEIKKKRDEITERYNELQEEEEIWFKEGNTAKLMRQARKELTSRAQCHRLNFTFVGSDHGRAFFEDDEINVGDLIYDFETYCREGELHDRRSKDKHNKPKDALHTAMTMKNGDKRKSAISEILQHIWADATGKKSRKLRWDEWADDFLKAHHRLVGWPAEIKTWPSRPRPYGSIDRGKDGRILGEALLTEEGAVRSEKWSDKEIKLANSGPRQCLDKDPNWMKIPIIVDQEGNPLLTIGEIEAQATTRDEFAKGHHEQRAKKIGQKRKRKGGDGEETEGEEETVEEEIVEVLVPKKKQKAVVKERKPPAEKKNSKNSRAKQAVSKEFVEDSDEQEAAPRTGPSAPVRVTASEEPAYEMVGGGFTAGSVDEQVNNTRYPHDGYPPMSPKSYPDGGAPPVQDHYRGAPQTPVLYGAQPVTYTVASSAYGLNPPGSFAAPPEQYTNDTLVASYGPRPPSRNLVRPPSRALSRPPSRALSQPPSRAAALIIHGPIDPRCRSMSAEPRDTGYSGGDMGIRQPVQDVRMRMGGVDAREYEGYGGAPHGSMERVLHGNGGHYQGPSMVHPTQMQTSYGGYRPNGAYEHGATRGHAVSSQDAQTRYNGGYWGHSRSGKGLPAVNTHLGSTCDDESGGTQYHGEERYGVGFPEDGYARLRVDGMQRATYQGAAYQGNAVYDAWAGPLPSVPEHREH
ncbi:hypothetical protein M422DRAFT_257524 [Sphaerobolus stellatus SS14]|uniref:Uncharacterized protein n=1 Tax=Sphaerobolus stellatus (strain SS14) TaxID=990650 RepID=A0A0C9VNP2_SPHS4|nr:hypothetical protein M422DRAFT_257524 [Sphaerobolus stellatus SS14]